MAAPGPRRVLRLSPARPLSAGRDRAGGNQRQIPRLLPRENLDGNPGQPKLAGSARAGRRMVGHPRGCPTAGGRPPPPVKKRRRSATVPAQGGPTWTSAHEVSSSSPPRRAQTQRVTRTTAARKCRHARADTSVHRYLRVYIFMCVRVSLTCIFSLAASRHWARASVCTYVYIQTWPSVRVSVCLSVCRSVCLSACMHVCMYGITVCL